MSYQHKPVFSLVTNIFLLLMLIWHAPLQAATITVDTLLDDGSAGNCELREAINAANTNASVDNCATGDPGVDIIDLQGMSGTIVLSPLLPTISEDLVITGPGPGTLTVDANDRGRVFEIFGGNHSVEISGLTITGGTFFLPIDIGGGIRVGTGVTLNLNNSVVTGNRSIQRGGGIDIATGATVTLNNTIVSNNTASNNAGGINNNQGFLILNNGSTVSNNTANQGNGGGIYNDAGEVTIYNSTIGPLNEGNDGGGIYNNEGTLTITGSRITDNAATGTAAMSGGGGIADINGTVTITETEISGNSARNGGGVFELNLGTITINESTISSNTSVTGGGGINNNFGNLTLTNSIVGPTNSALAGGGIYNVGALDLSNVTISGNSTTGLGGAGIYQSNSPLTWLKNVTITNNTTGNSPGGGVNVGGGAFVISNSVIAGNIDSSGTGAPDCWGTITTGGYNLIQDNMGCIGTGANDITGLDPLLGGLNDNGGPTLTHALQSNSPAIDAANPAGCVDHDTTLLTRDQRGITRPQDGDDNGTIVCDIGAYEFSLPADIDVTDSLSPNADLHLPYGDIQTGSSNDQVVTLANVGQQDLQITGVQLSGADTADFSFDLMAGGNPCGGLVIVIPAGDSCTVGVSFIPQNDGLKNAFLDINSNDPDEGTVRLALSGTGISSAAGGNGSNGGGGSSGGCTVASDSSFDPLFFLLITMSVFYLWRHRLSGRRRVMS